MKNIVKLSIYLGIFITIYITGGQLINQLLTEVATITNTTLLFQYGGMIGFSLFVIFIIMLQSETVTKIRIYKPRLSMIMFYTYIISGITLIILTILYFTLQIAILMALLFMLLTAILDMIRDKIIQVHEGNALHPKKTI
ncbi:MAG: hypothetical protein WC992_04855 [Acholeplasmataceae bacterium]|jgi:hypothetical protein|nr:hypothetical protein [Acholeplasmataceae bacterium]